MSDLVDLEDGHYTAVVDTIEDGLAIVFFEQDGEEVNDAVIDAGSLPKDGRHANAILTVGVATGELIQVDYKPEQTEERKQAAQDRFDRLSFRPPRDDDET